MSLMLTENGGKSRVFGNMSFHAHCKNQTTDLEVRGSNPLGRASYFNRLADQVRIRWHCFGTKSRRAIAHASGASVSALKGIDGVPSIMSLR